MNISDHKDKSKKTMFDENDGFSFMHGWSPTARWISMIPAVLLAFFLSRYLIIGTLVMVLQNFLPEFLWYYSSAILVFFVYYITVYVGGAAVPVGSRRVLSAVLALLISIALIILFVGFWSQVEGHDTAILIISTLMSVLGCVAASLKHAKK
ncbi:hypothetical protein N7D90_15860 [Pseudomonas fragi]|uniref:hypothetical protein n=1 Tax=Pseudomonas fragi TaxID=296 RepID=UPI0021C18CA6|nr:hypothetical protein [Pseudomonas fragi]UXL37056.1 hypothetical protein N7D90_15860 [Pseudomonas fragi]